MSTFHKTFKGWLLLVTRVIKYLCVNFSPRIRQEKKSESESKISVLDFLILFYVYNFYFSSNSYHIKSLYIVYI
jgi:hypothetical protein